MVDSLVSVNDLVDMGIYNKLSNFHLITMQRGGHQDQLTQLNVVQTFPQPSCDTNKVKNVVKHLRLIRRTLKEDCIQLTITNLEVSAQSAAWGSLTIPEDD